MLDAMDAITFQL